MTDRNLSGPQIAGWAAIAVSTGFACLWAWWGAIENFHEGWYHPSLWRNLLLLLVQYLSPMLLVMAISSVALRRPRLAMPVMVIGAIGSAWFFGGFRIRSAAVELIGLPLIALGVLFYFGRPEPRRWAWRGLIGLPLITAVASGTYPGWTAIHRFDDGNYGARLIVGNGLTLEWAPEGPGWPDDGVSWYEAKRSCAFLAADGRTLSASPLNLWRLPTVDETVRSLVFRGENSGGTWDAAHKRAEFRKTPDKDSPLWKVHSKVIYWWTATEANGKEAYYVTNNGYVHPLAKRLWPGYLAYRCVKEPETAKGP